MRRLGAQGAAALAAACLAACALGTAAAGADSQNPFVGGPWYVDANTAAARAERAAADSGRDVVARQLDTIASRPQSLWFIAADDPDSSSYVHAYFRRATTAGPNALLAITLHGLPQQICAGDNAPGAQTQAAYRAWIDGYARQIGSRRTVVFLEPDALAASSCLSGPDRRIRLSLMSYAARTLSALPRTAVYEDIGAGDWRSLGDAARLLRAAGVRYARGFSLNTTHYDWTSAEVAYGVRLARMLGRKHFVVNTSFNGRGPKLGALGAHEWCNPRGRALGPLPTTATGNALADAFYWIGNPGLSDGACNGGPEVGSFWLDWALELVRNSAGAQDFPVVRHR